MRDVVVQYVVSDQGINLCKAYAQVRLTHIPDCSHVLANGMEKLYKNIPQEVKDELVFLDQYRIFIEELS